MSDAQVEVDSTIIGVHNGAPYKVDYLLMAGPNWATLSCKIKIRVGEADDVRTFQHDGRGNWTCNGASLDECKGATEIDISVTPFTNSLPINRLKMPVGESRRIQVVYIDVLGGTVRSATQQYTRISGDEFRYENVPNDFEAVITVDESGIVREYPELFTRQKD